MAYQRELMAEQAKREQEYEILNKHAPEKTIKVRPLPKPWLPKELKEKINRKNNLRKAAVRLKSPASWEDYRKEKQNVRIAIDNAKDQFFKNLLEENKNNYSQVWKSIRRLIPSKKDNIGIPHNWSNKKIATDINKVFVNIGPETKKTLRSSQKRFLFPFNIKSQFSFPFNIKSQFSFPFNIKSQNSDNSRSSKYHSRDPKKQVHWLRRHRHKNTKNSCRHCFNLYRTSDQSQPSHW